MSDATKQQWSAFRWGSLTLIAAIVAVLLEWNFEVPVTYWWITGGIGAAVSLFFWVKFFKRTVVTSRHEDGGSSV